MFRRPPGQPPWKRVEESDSPSNAMDYKTDKPASQSKVVPSGSAFVLSPALRQAVSLDALSVSSLSVTGFPLGAPLVPSRFAPCPRPRLVAGASSVALPPDAHLVSGRSGCCSSQVNFRPLQVGGSAALALSLDAPMVSSRARPCSLSSLLPRPLSVGCRPAQLQPTDAPVVSGSSASSSWDITQTCPTDIPTAKRLRLATPSSATELHASAGMTVPKGRSNAGPTPSQEIILLRGLKEKGIDIAKVLDNIAQARAQAAVATSTSSTYASHIRMISWACSILQEPPMPASLTTILRVASLINNPSTLQGWLAAWRNWHVSLRKPWLGDKDPFLKNLRAGTSRLAPLPRVKGR